MAGGTFDINVGKVRPGTYVNVEPRKQQKPSGSMRGIAVVPLLGYDWGPNGQLIKLSADSADAEIIKLGRSIYDDHDSMLLIREIFKCAVTCYVYIINSGEKATAVSESGISMTAAYGGSLGNSLKVSCVANTEGKFDVSVYMDTTVVESYQNLETVEDLLSASKKEYVVFTAADANAKLVAFASIALSGGTTVSAQNTDVTEFLDKSENVKWNTMCFPCEDKDLQKACESKIKYLRDNTSRRPQAVMPNCGSDYEGIINVTNSVMVDGKTLTVAQACAFATGVTAGADKVTSNTYVEYQGAEEVVDVKTNEQSILAIQNGEFFYSVSEEGKVIVEYDINSLHTYTSGKTEDYSKNRVLRVYDSFAEDLALTFPPNKYPNTTEGRLIMEGLGKALLKSYFEAGAITDVDYDNDFFVNQSREGGDETYFNVGIKAVDSAEKLYFSVATR